MPERPAGRPRDLDTGSELRVLSASERSPSSMASAPVGWIDPCMGRPGKLSQRTPRRRSVSSLLVLAGSGSERAVAYPMSLEQRWFALRVRPRAEKSVATALRGKGYPEFLPLHRQKRRWSDRVVDVDLPLFPGLRLLAVRGRPAPSHPHDPRRAPCRGLRQDPSAGRRRGDVIPQALVRSHAEVQPWPHQFIGDRVRLTDGPLAGVEGTLTSVKGIPTSSSPSPCSSGRSPLSCRPTRLAGRSSAVLLSAF